MVEVYVNISMECISFLFTLILLITCLMQKKRSHTTNIFVGMILSEVIVLLVQLTQWVIYYYGLQGTSSELSNRLMNVLFCFDFSLMHFQMVAFFFYVLARVDEDRHVSEKKRKVERILRLTVLSIGIICCIVFTSSLWTKAIFYYSGHSTTVNMHYYVWLQHSSNIASLLCAAVIIRNWKLLGNSTAIFMLLFLIARETILPIDILNDTSFSYVFMAVEMMVLYFGVDMQRSEQLMEQEIRLTKQKAELERQNVQVMVSQIQPHFLYNTLSVIDYLCGKDVERARTAINAFAEYLRMNMESISSSEPVLFEKELDHTKTYLWIEEMRFGDILNVEYDIRVSDFVLPPLSLQPLCENAVKHGVRGRENGGTVRISTRRNGSTIFIHVEDDGVGFDVNQEYGENEIHVGIDNVRKRLEMMGNGRLDIMSRPGIGTIATIVLEEQ